MDILNKSFKRLLASFLRERNALNLVASLPADINGEILGYGGLVGAMKGSFVCHKWRTSAISKPSLWCDIDMNAPKYDEELLQLQMDRSGAVPLNLNLNLTMERHRLTNGKVPKVISLESLITRSRSISNICTSTFPGPTTSLPSLESLHVILDMAYIQSGWIGPHPNLWYLSINCGGFDLSQWHSNDFSRNIRTLHITGANSLPSDLISFILQFPRLQELSLESPTNFAGSAAGSDRVIREATQVPSLSLIKLGNFSQTFLYNFLRPAFILPETNLYINQFPLDHRASAFTNLRDDPVSSIWINLATRSIIYNHDTALTELVLEAGGMSGREFEFYFPMCIELETVLSLSWINGDPLRADKLAPFQSLVHLSFIYSPPVVGIGRTLLSDTLSRELVFACPRLSNISLILRKSNTSSMTFKDDAESVIMDFLKDWLDIHRVVFSDIEIQDEIKPSRWEGCMAALEALVGSFRVVEILAGFLAPKFPKVREFHVQG